MGLGDLSIPGGNHQIMTYEGNMLAFMFSIWGALRKNMWEIFIDGALGETEMKMQPSGLDGWGCTEILKQTPDNALP